MEAPPERTIEHLQRLRAWVIGRIVLAVAAAGGALLAPPLEPATLRLLLAVLAVWAFTGVALFLVPLRPVPLRALAQGLLLADTAAVTFLVYLTGWAGSPFLPLSFYAVLGAAFLLGGRAPLLYASAMVLSLCAVTGFYRAAALAHAPPPFLPVQAAPFWDRELGYFLGHLLLEAAALHAVASLSVLLTARLSREEVLVREVLDHMGEGVLAVDDDGRLIVANSQAQRCLGLAGVEPGRSLASSLASPVSSWLLPALAARASFQMAQTVEGLPLAVQVSPLGAGPGRRGTVVLVTDLTREREAAAAERRAERMEASARLALGIAHEIRNPLASIRGAAQELARAPDPRLTAMILKESDRLDRILGDFLAYARLEAPRPSRVDLGALLEETVALVGSREDARDIRFQSATPKGLAVSADSGQLKELFLNLLINAVQAGAREIRVTATREARVIRVEISDDGPGVSAEARGRIFEPFFTTKPRGTGLGLALAARVAAAHGGELRLAAAGAGPGGGACFEVLLPEGSHVGS